MSHSARLRKVGRSIMLAIPPAIVAELKLKPHSVVQMSTSRGRLIIHTKSRPFYTLDQLLKEGRRAKNLLFKDKAWLSTPPVGSELI